MWNYMMGWGGNYGYGMMGGAGLITMFLVWAALILVIALLWKYLNK